MLNRYKSLWYWLCRYLLIIIPDKAFCFIISYLTFKRLGFKYYKYNLNNPTSFNEILSSIKISKKNEIYSKYADKFLVREYVAESIGEKYLVNLLGVYKNSSEIDFEALPMQFALKTNHGSGWNVICKDKLTLNFGDTRKILNQWLGYNAFYLSREYQYKNIEPLIICEELLKFDIYDYKFFCFNGNPEIVQLDIDRYTNHKRAFYNMNWVKQDFSIRYEISEKLIEKPIQFDEMKEVCRMLSKPFNFVRVDLYLHKERIYFGELTFFPGGGNEPFNPVEYDFEFGKYF